MRRFSGLKSPEQLYRVLGVLCIVVHMLLIGDKLFNGLWGLAGLEALICTLVLINLEASYRGHRFPIPIAVVLTLLAVDLPFAIQGLGVQEVYWAFPTIVGFIAISEGRVGLGLSVALCVLLPVVLAGMGQDIRFLAPLTLSLGLVTAFSWFMARRIGDLQKQARNIKALDAQSGAYSRGYLDFLSKSNDWAQTNLVLVDWQPKQGVTPTDLQMETLAGLLGAELGGRDLLFRVDDRSLLVLLPEEAAHVMFERAQAFQDITEASALSVEGRARFGCASLREGEAFWDAVSRARDRILTAKHHSQRRVV
ncbi:hypothetical protein TRM7557_03489 [Tritonibacter multivorans]|uniref:SRP54-type proteins GTP-binding domain-containing protein n=1 Tax=Tritonibacter multivorans TaxID=928856 RepID=A0A0P1GJ64_9RHOB|nr:hypothetical protein [Tritonibacter multivorans]MDA7420456.1 hypothetical protein [Tritonibacter multivorans]CUH81568.1 hypothetical protein TRM7557_03489 [Tritonibacter multivorans]SFC38338.1 hypothetical protein SAMN04488049_102326 [Tritonibacter multivorans]